MSENFWKIFCFTKRLISSQTDDVTILNCILRFSSVNLDLQRVFVVFNLEKIVCIGTCFQTLIAI